MIVPPECAARYIEWLHPASLILAITLPCIRASIRKVRGNKAFTTSNVVHDSLAGFTIPSFIALVLTPVFPNIAGSLDGHTLFFAGMLGIVFTIREIAEAGP